MLQKSEFKYTRKWGDVWGNKAMSKGEIIIMGDFNNVDIYLELYLDF